MSNSSPQPFITIVTVVYNAVKDIEKNNTISTQSNLSKYIIDGGSTHGTFNIIKNTKVSFLLGK